jgi:hyperosmotically inducible protein
MTGFRKFLTVSAVALMSVPAVLLASNKYGGDITREVRHELVMLPYYSIFDNLSYRVDGNTVTLFGQVTRPTLKSDA